MVLTTLALAVNALVSGATVAVFGSVETWVAADFGTGLALSGLVQSFYYAGIVSGSIAVAAGMGRIDPRLVQRTSFALLVAGNLICVVQSFPALLFGRLLAGAGMSGTAVITTVILLRLYPERQTVYISAQHGLVALGGALVLFWGRALAEALGGWRWAFAILAVLAAFPLVTMWQAVHLAPSRGSAPPWKEIGKAVAIPRVALAILLSMLYVCAELALTTFLPAFIEREVGRAAVASSQIAALFWLGLGGGRFVSMALMRVAKERVQIIVSGCGGAIALLGAVAFGASALVSGAVFLAGFLFGPMVPVAFSYATRHAPRVKGPLIGIANLLVSLGAGIALPLAGALGDLTSLRVALSLMFALPLLGAAAFWLGTHRP